MKKWFRSPKALFRVLQVVSVLAMLGGVWLSAQLLYPLAQRVPDLDDGALHSLLPAGYIAGTIVCNVLWCTAWSSFIGMCRRLQDGTSAFTRANSRTLALIGLCVTSMAGLVCIMGIAGLLQRFSLSGVILAFILPGVFLTVAMLAMILRRLLDNAMVLEQEQADVI